MYETTICRAVKNENSRYLGEITGLSWLRDRKPPRLVAKRLAVFLVYGPHVTTIMTRMMSRRPPEPASFDEGLRQSNRTIDDHHHGKGQQDQ